MRRFRLLADDYANLLKGQIYPENWSVDDLERNVFDYFIMHPQDWQEVFDEPKTLHKDTDLGYFAGLAMVGYLSNSNPDVVRMDQEEIAEYCVNHAKELIKQLDLETK